MQNTRRKIAITNDTTIMRCRLLVKLIEMAGAEPVLMDIKTNGKSIEQHLKDIRASLKECSAIILPGNKYDVHPKNYNESFIHDETEQRLDHKNGDTRFEIEKLMLEYAMQNQLPILGICGGFQTANVVLGGKLTQHIPDIVNHRLHRDNNISDLTKEDNAEFERNFEGFITNGKGKQIFGASHDFKVKPNNIIADLYDNKNLGSIGELNLHHQGMFESDLSDRLEAVGISDDGVIEAAVIKDYPYGIFFQPHIECNVNGIAFKAVSSLLSSNR